VLELRRFDDENERDPFLGDLRHAAWALKAAGGTKDAAPVRKAA
jgi:hypothetical protein